MGFSMYFRQHLFAKKSGTKKKAPFRPPKKKKTTTNNKTELTSCFFCFYPLPYQCHISKYEYSDVIRASTNAKGHEIPPEGHSILSTSMFSYSQSIRGANH